MRVLSSILFASLLLLSCKPSTDAGNTSSEGSANDLKALEDQVMAIHDEVMPKMADITKLTAELRAIKATIKENPDGKIVSPDGLEELMGSLKLAEQGMWDWMKAYSDTKPTIKEDQMKSFYESQLETINKIKQDMLGSIEKAQTWLAAYKAK
ncbi:MAG TPA: hypothetical protein PLR30_03680 [Saprospiraceae bacterium]|nr:hypothetical protein [Saprospiraceae bacterium]